MSDQQTELEIKVTFLERTVNELSDALYEQQKTIEQLAKRVSELVSRVEMAESAEGGPLPHVKPPHH